MTYEVVADGGTDRVLVPIIEWAIHRLDPGVEILEPEFRKRKGSVREFLENHRSGAMLVFVHRDAEREGRAARLEEFSSAGPGVVPVIPVRMSEAWLMTDPWAIARAADRPDAIVQLPSLARLEQLADPKRALEELLLTAAGGISGRRRKRFLASMTERRVNVASLTTDFGGLESVPAFMSFQQDLERLYPYTARDWRAQ